jgi:hypothetical protein
MEHNNMDGLFERAQQALDVAKKLTTKDRKKLKSGTFCGPGRSFPVPDCQHVSTAKAFLGRSKFSASTKQKIAACINRKSKQLGCGGDKKAKASENEFPKYIELSAEQKKLYSSDIFESTKKLVEESLANPGMDLDFDLTQIEDTID